jgi:hypothetical protein
MPDRGTVWLEITQEPEVAGYLKDQTIKRSDLAFITDGGESVCLMRLTLFPQMPPNCQRIRAL